MKVIIITCYRDPDYVRAQTLRAGVIAQPETEAIIIKNKYTGWRRYPEVMLKLAGARLRHRPDVYLLTFRGYEILPWVLLMAGRRPVIFDEFINLVEWTVYEHRKVSETGRAARILAGYYNFLLRRCRYILADTPEHAVYSNSLSRVGLPRYRAIPVSTDQRLFKPAGHPAAKPGKDKFRVFYYGNMLPLHGLQYVLGAAVRLKDQPVEFRLVGGKGSTRAAVDAAQAAGAHITYEPWVEFAELPARIAAADLCLAGPFGDTVQAQFVVTGKAYQFLACAVPTVIGRTKAAGMFHDKKDCLLVPLGDTAALADVIAWARGHRGELAKIGQNGRELYEREFSQAVVARELKAVLKDCA